jgi:transglutaminase-like putative cysteine protease
MGYRLSWLAGGAGVAFALVRLERLLLASSGGLPWEVVLIASAVLGATISWAGVAYRVRGAFLTIIHLAAITLTVVRIAVPESTWLIFPTRESFTELGAELTFARDVIRAGIAPVIPLAGLVAILAVVFWGMGALLAWGLLTGRPYVAVVTPLVVYLEFAVLDRRIGGWWTAGFMVLIGVTLIAVTIDRRREGAGLLSSARDGGRIRRSIPAMGVGTLLVTVLLAVNASDAIAGLVPRRGFLEWEGASNLSGDFFGSVSYNPFVGIQQSLVAQTNVPVFVFSPNGGRVGSIPQGHPADQVYWRLVALDAFDGDQWHVGSPRLSNPADLERLEDASAAFAGPTAGFSADVTILALQMDWLPAPYAPVSLTADEGVVQSGFRVRRADGSLHFDALTYRGMTYTIQSEIPQPSIDILSRRADGTPSIIFRSAIETGDFGLVGVELPTIENRGLPDAERYLELPDELDERIGLLAQAQIGGLETDFERALALEDFFRSPGGFVYSVNVPPGHGASVLADWLLEPESDNYRTGYCEQFATSMAVMARTIGIPSRVVLGFTPGNTLEDGRLVVRDRNAHAWVELWMPSQGWVKFDPTPRTDGANPTTADDLPFRAGEHFNAAREEAPRTDPRSTPVTTAPTNLVDPDLIGGGEAEASPSATSPNWLVPGLAIVLFLGLAPTVKWVRRRRRLHRLEHGDVTGAWQEIVDRLSDLGADLRASETPTEVAASVGPALESLAAVYSEAAYGPGGQLPARQVAVATRSLGETEADLAREYSMFKRVVASYRLRSLVRRVRKGGSLGSER